MARGIKSLPDFSYRIGLVFIDTGSGQQKRVILNDPVWVNHIKSRADMVPDISDSFLVGMLQNMLDWPEEATYTVQHKNPVIARSIGLYKLAKRRETLHVISL